jgi:hypothetical protein
VEFVSHLKNKFGRHWRVVVGEYGGGVLAFARWYRVWKNLKKNLTDIAGEGFSVLFRWQLVCK